MTNKAHLLNEAEMCVCLGQFVTCRLSILLGCGGATLCGLALAMLLEQLLCELKRLLDAARALGRQRACQRAHQVVAARRERYTAKHICDSRRGTLRIATTAATAFEDCTVQLVLELLVCAQAIARVLQLGLERRAALHCVRLQRGMLRTQHVETCACLDA